jgi:uncharacterized protein YaiE (UPF0345 family)
LKLQSKVVDFNELFANQTTTSRSIGIIMNTEMSYIEEEEESIAGVSTSIEFTNEQRNDITPTQQNVSNEVSNSSAVHMSEEELSIVHMVKLFDIQLEQNNITKTEHELLCEDAKRLRFDVCEQLLYVLLELAKIEQAKEKEEKQQLRAVYEFKKSVAKYMTFNKKH